MAYRRLLPRERGIFRYAELWTEDDHLLSVHSSRLTVEYQRFPFSEIQAVSVTELPHWTGPQMAAASAALILFVISVATPPGVPLKAFFGFFTIWPLLYAARELWRGPKCKAYVYTVTGAQLVPAVSRVSRAEAFFDAINPLVENVQGRVESLQVRERPAVDIEAQAAEQLLKQRPLRLMGWGLSALANLHVMATWKWTAAMTRFDSLGLLLSLAGIVVLVAAWRGSTPAMRRLRPYVLVTATFGVWFVEAVAIVAWMVTVGPVSMAANAIMSAIALAVCLAGIAVDLWPQPPAEPPAEPKGE